MAMAMSASLSSTTTTLCASSMRIVAAPLPPSQSFLGLGWKRKSWRRVVVVAVTQGSSSEDENIPTWANPDSDEAPPWARDRDPTKQGGGFELPFYVYLLASAITAIAAIGSIFEYVNGRAVFGVLGADSVFYGPLLGFFAFTGIPSSAFLWFKSVEAANKEAQEQDKRDGYY